MQMVQMGCSVLSFQWAVADPRVVVDVSDLAKCF